MARSDRHLKIIDLVSKYDIDTQEELVKRLKTAGYNVTQATVSRDVKELGLIKVMDEERKYKYSYVKTDQNQAGMMLTLFRETILTIDSAQNLIVIKCISGGAGATGSMIDKMNIAEIIGTIAGDDTVLVIVSTTLAVKNIVNKLKQMII